MHTYTDLCLAHPLESWTPFDIVVNSAYALLTIPVTYKPTNIITPPFIRYSGSSAYTTQRTAEDTEEETGLMCYSSVTRNFVLTNTVETKLLDNSITSNITPSTLSTNLRAYAWGKHPTLLPTDIILDTGAYCSIVHNRSLLTNLKSCKPVIFDGLSGSISITQKGSLGTICDAYYHKDIIANILSVSAIKNEGHTLGYENDSHSFYLSHPCGQAIFTRRDNGLCVCNFGPSNLFLSTVSDLESQYTKREVQEAQASRVLLCGLAAPPNMKLIKALSDGTIRGTTVTAEHVRWAASIYGPSLESIKGRTTSKKGTPIPIANHHRVTDSQTMYIDIYFACTLPYLITKVQPLDHIMTSLLPERSATAIRKTFIKHIRFYGRRGIRISALLSDNEQVITSLGLQFEGAKIVLTQSGPGMHIPQVERSIRAVKERTRGILHTLPYNCPLVLFAHLPEFVAARMSIFKSSTRPVINRGITLTWRSPEVE